MGCTVRLLPGDPDDGEQADTGRGDRVPLQQHGGPWAADVRYVERWAGGVRGLVMTEVWLLALIVLLAVMLGGATMALLLERCQ